MRYYTLEPRSFNEKGAYTLGVLALLMLLSFVWAAFLILALLLAAAYTSDYLDKLMWYKFKREYFDVTIDLYINNDGSGQYVVTMLTEVEDEELITLYSFNDTLGPTKCEAAAEAKAKSRRIMALAYNADEVRDCLIQVHF